MGKRKTLEEKISKIEFKEQLSDLNGQPECEQDSDYDFWDHLEDDFGVDLEDDFGVDLDDDFNIEEDPYYDPYDCDYPFPEINGVDYFIYGNVRYEGPRPKELNDKLWEQLRQKHEQISKADFQGRRN